MNDDRTYPKYTRHFLVNGDVLDVTDATGATRRVRVTGEPGFRDTFRAAVADENGVFGAPGPLADVGIERNNDGMYSTERAYCLTWAGHAVGRHFVLSETQAYALVERWRARCEIVEGDLKDPSGIRHENSFGQRATLAVNVRS